MKSEKYRSEHITEEQISEVLQQKCRRLCLAGGETPTTVCSSPNTKISPYFRGAKPAKGAYRHLKGENYPREAVDCWAALPGINLSQVPKSFVGEATANKLMNSACYRCMNEENKILRIKNSVGPDKRFLIGASAAGAGLVIALLTGLIRRGAR